MGILFQPSLAWSPGLAIPTERTGNALAGTGEHLNHRDSTESAPEIQNILTKSWVTEIISLAFPLEQKALSQLTKAFFNFFFFAFHSIGICSSWTGSAWVHQNMPRIPVPDGAMTQNLLLQRRSPAGEGFTPRLSLQLLAVPPPHLHRYLKTQSRGWSQGWMTPGMDDPRDGQGAPQLHPTNCDSCLTWN